MKPEEAIGIVGDFISEETHLRKYPKVVVMGLSEALISLKKCTDKQVAKKPIDIYNRVPLIIIYCPECEKNLADEYGNRYEYCPDCGTPIDWGN